MDIASIFRGERTAKAETGIGSVMMTNNPPASIFARSPQRMASDAQAIAISDVTIRSAERVIANRFATTPWHLEDADDVEVGTGDGENADPRYLAVLALLKRPYRPLPGDPVSTTPRTWSQLASLTCRHIGVTGSAFWYLDQTDALAGTPLAILYVNPARMTPLLDDSGSLVDWVLDADSRGGGVRLGRSNVIHFQLEPPDVGVFPAGLVETALAKVELSKLTDRHISNVLASGGRLAGLISPREGFLEDAVYSQLVRDVRAIAEAPDAARRMLILRGPVDYTTSTATPSDLDLAALATMTRDDKLSLWGIPHSILGIPQSVGLGGEKAKSGDEAIFWQNAVGPRLRTFAETVQAELLDRYMTVGIDVTIELEEPSFDDEMPRFEMAAKARDIPMSNRERRDLVGLDPFGDARDDEVWLPTGIVNAYGVTGAMRPTDVETYASEYEDPFDDDVSVYGKAISVPAFVRANARRGLQLVDEGRGGDGLVPSTIRDARDLARGIVTDAKIAKIGPWIARHLVDLEAPANRDQGDSGYPGPGLVAMLLWGAGPDRVGAERTMAWAERETSRLTGKARVSGIDTIREDETVQMRDAVLEAMAAIIRDAAAKIERNVEHLRRKPTDSSVWWNEEAARSRLAAAVEGRVPIIARRTTNRVEAALPATKADLLEQILPRLMERVGLRIVTLPSTLFGEIQKRVELGLAEGLGPKALGTLIEDVIDPDPRASFEGRQLWNERGKGGAKYLAERIARTETNRVLNDAALEGFRTYGIADVIAVDGDGDALCADRNGRRFSVDAAMAEEDHPNGTLSWDPVVDTRDLAFAKAEDDGMAYKALGSVTIPSIKLEPIIQLNVPEQPAPIVNVAPPVINLPAPVVNVEAATIPAPVVNVAAPIVNVPEVKAGLVQDIRIVEMPPRTVTQVVVRDAAGRIVGTETAEE